MITLNEGRHQEKKLAGNFCVNILVRTCAHTLTQNTNTYNKYTHTQSHSIHIHTITYTRHTHKHTIIQTHQTRTQNHTNTETPTHTQTHTQSYKHTRTWSSLWSPFPVNLCGFFWMQRFGGRLPCSLAACRRSYGVFMSIVV